ncbi:phosphate butyryltransferase [Bacillus songklensis]|uniref:Phosphate butyryltransferase n=1 Tax=Bacillus songklensis TaxID=1069116 RepID=A0ABV8AZY3_9BACI
MKFFETILNEARQQSHVVIAVAAAEDQEVIEAVLTALQQQLGRFILYGNQEKIKKAILQYAPELFQDGRVQIFHSLSNEYAAKAAVRAVHLREATVLMKGNVPTATLLKEVLNKEYGLRTENLLSHVALFDAPHFSKPIIVTDAAMNIAPGLTEKVQILQNAVEVARGIGISIPKVAPIAAVEVVNPNMQATMDAAALTQMNRRGQIKNCIVDGPLALDNAVSMEAARHKGIASEVAGDADILLMPGIEEGNILYKSLIYFGQASVAGLIDGAKAPVVFTSRSDSAKSKLYSIALAICAAKRAANKRIWEE